jgi:hypothetical protein
MTTRHLVRFLLRGVGKVSGEWSLWCTSHNLLKLWRSGFVPGLKRVAAANSSATGTARSIASVSSRVRETGVSTVF